MVESIEIILSRELNADVEIELRVVRNHASLENLDYAHSGHTGFASKNYVDTELGSKADLVDGKVPSTQLPSYVDDVLEYANKASFPATGESGKIYVAADENKCYRWSGSIYVEISSSLSLGETSSTAYAGNKGKANADAIAQEVTDRQNAIDAIPAKSGTGTDSIRQKNATASGADSAAFGTGTASSQKAHAEGSGTTASGPQSHAEGNSTKAAANQSHAEGYGSEANANGAHAEGDTTKANGIYSHSEGCETHANHEYAHSEGKQTLANGAQSHSEGNKTIAGGSSAHSEGSMSEALGYASHAEGESNLSGSQETHTEGESNVAQGYASHVQGIGNESTRLVQDVSGQYAVKDATSNTANNNTYVFKAISGQRTYTIPSTIYTVISIDRVRVNGNVVNNYTTSGHSITFSTAPAANSAIEVRFNGKGSNSKGNLVIVGNGTSDGNRSNAYTLDWNGNAHFKGNVYVNANADGTGGTSIGTAVLYHHRIKFSAGYRFNGTEVTVYAYSDLFINVASPFDNTTFWTWYFARVEEGGAGYENNEKIPCFGINKVVDTGVNYLFIITSLFFSEGIGEKLFGMNTLAPDMNYEACSYGNFTTGVTLVSDEVFR